MSTIGLSTSPLSSDIKVEPKERVEFLKKHLLEHDSIRLIVTEAVDATSPEAKGPFAHCLTIERNGKGFRVQNISVDSDRNIFIGEHLITRLGKYVEIPGGPPATTTTMELGDLLREYKPIRHEPQESYRRYSATALLDRLILDEKTTNDVRQVEANRTIEVPKSEFDQHMRRALTALGDEVSQRLKANTIPYPLKETVEVLLVLAKARAAQTQLQKSLHENGLAGFTFSGEDMM